MARLGASGRGAFAVLDPSFPARTVHAGALVLEDISTRGARIEVAAIPEERVTKLAAGQELMAVTLDEALGGPVRALATVRWVTQIGDSVYRMGIEFTEMSEEQKARLKQHIYGLLGFAGIRMEESSRALRRKLRRVSPYLVAAAAVLLGLVVGHLTSRSYAADPAGICRQQSQAARRMVAYENLNLERRSQ